MIIRVRVGSSSGFKSEPLEFEIPNKGALCTLVRTAREMGLYSPSPISAEDCAQIGYAWRGHWKKKLGKYGHSVVHYTYMAIYYGHEKGCEVRDFADFTTLVGELLRH